MANMAWRETPVSPCSSGATRSNSSLHTPPPHKAFTLATPDTHIRTRRKPDWLRLEVLCLKAHMPRACYRAVARINPNITYPGDVVGNPRAEVKVKVKVKVKVSPDSTILSRRIVQTSGNKAWDDAVLRAIDKTEVFPKDTDGRIPPVIVLGFRPLD